MKIVERKNLINQVLNLDEYKSAINKLRLLRWDVEEPIVVFSDYDLKSALLKFKENTKVEEIEDWANFIECRDDIDFESEWGKELIENLANPELYGTTKEVLEKQEWYT